jgi:hypothetical protein
MQCLRCGTEIGAGIGLCEVCNSTKGVEDQHRPRDVISVIAKAEEDSTEIPAGFPIRFLAYTLDQSFVGIVYYGCLVLQWRAWSACLLRVEAPRKVHRRR